METIPALLTPGKGSLTGYELIPLIQDHFWGTLVIITLLLTKQTIEQPVELPVVWDTVTLIWHPCNVQIWVTITATLCI